MPLISEGSIGWIYSCTNTEQFSVSSLSLMSSALQLVYFPDCRPSCCQLSTRCTPAEPQRWSLHNSILACPSPCKLTVTGLLWYLGFVWLFRCHRKLWHVQTGQCFRGTISDTFSNPLTPLFKPLSLQLLPQI